MTIDPFERASRALAAVYGQDPDEIRSQGAHDIVPSMSLPQSSERIAEWERRKPEVVEFLRACREEYGVSDGTLGDDIFISLENAGVVVRTRHEFGFKFWTLTADGQKIVKDADLTDPE